MSDTADGKSQPIEEIAGGIIRRDLARSPGRPGKNAPVRGLTRARAIMLGVLAAVVVGVVLVLTLRGGGGPSNKGNSGSVAGYVCHGHEATLFDNINAQAVSNGASRPTFSTQGKAYCLMYVQTYHWNKGAGSAPGTIGLVRVNGPGALPSYIGALPAKTTPGSNGVANVNWYANISLAKPVILDGTYSCVDSDPATWSSNSASGGAGFCLVEASLAVR